ncbi:MAG: hypothetical protein R2706_11980 [Acidimicrobiales bacterium]
MSDPSWHRRKTFTITEVAITLIDPLGVPVSTAQHVPGHVAGDVLAEVVSSTKSQFPFLLI